MRSWQNGHLDVSGHGELTLDGCFRGGGRLEVVDVACERLLHVAEGVAQQAYFVIAAQVVGQCGIEISAGYLVGALGQHLEWSGGAPDADAADGGHGHQS